ncbi:lipid storage droplets surface-binding protein 1-like isoform X3 [Atheta coriaria]|uniref:lipid storage droplets surface-binding protein 1-like isoform X3 n=1 Tax=Dalotia coriaria TaxID=877792 RepID=UPI0031F3FB41
MVQNQSRMINLPELEAVNRISNLPIVETGWNYAEYMYQRIKHSNNLLQWTLDQAESSLYNVIDTASPAVFLLEGPLSTIDRLLCKSLDIVEQKVPSIHLPPQMIYTNTKQYVSDVGSKIVRPVLKRADSVKQIGNQVLESKFTAFAADKLDGALSVADMYVDKYLPADVFDKGNEGVDVVDAPPSGSGNAGKALHTGQHMFRFSKKLRRRLTQRTLLEAKALKEQSAEAIHVLVYVAELIATDPKLALQKGRELWATLSKDEPENQARPENLEQLIVLLTRETARRVVHLINFTAGGIGKVPRRVALVLNAVTTSCFQLLDTLMKTPKSDERPSGLALKNALRIQMILLGCFRIQDNNAH